MKPAGVYCFGQTNGQLKSLEINIHSHILCHAEETRCDDNEIRLSNGTNASGRVEVCLGGLWGTVCNHGWTRNDANTVCRQLGYDHST